MEWFWNAFWAYLGWNVAAPFAIVIAIVFVMAIFAAIHALRHRNCKHDQYFENMQCHAICRTCRRDLGFIGTWRELHGPSR